MATKDALQIANDTEYGPAGCVFTRDLDRGERFARSLQVGMAHVNDQPVLDLPNSPFGGEKNSGIGRFNGAWAIQAFTIDQRVTVQRSPQQYPKDAREVKGAWAGDELKPLGRRERSPGRSTYRENDRWM